MKNIEKGLLFSITAFKFNDLMNSLHEQIYRLIFTSSGKLDRMPVESVGSPGIADKWH